jgi:hypothetical protein
MAAVMAADCLSAVFATGKLCPKAQLGRQGKGSLTGDSYFARMKTGFNRN